MAKALYAQTGQPFLCAQGGYLIAGTDAAEPDCVCGGTPPPPPPPAPCCDTHPNCCFTTGPAIRITVTASYARQGWGCNTNPICGSTGWKSLATTGSGSALYGWSVTAGSCCPDTANYQDRNVGVLTTVYDLPEGGVCGGGVQQIVPYPVSVLIVSGLDNQGVMRTWIWVKAVSKTFIFNGCASGSQTNTVNQPGSFSSSCGTSPPITTSETITIAVEGLAACSSGGGGPGGGDTLIFDGHTYPPGWVLNSDGVPIPPSHNCNGCGQ